MKILELHIENVRGIPNIYLEPNGSNFAIWGPNGSGKSAVVDAVDFLLTGRITRLTGSGTRGITLGRYGPHVDCDPDEATVRAVILLSGKSAPVSLERSMGKPTELIYDEEYKTEVEEVLEVAKRGQHFLSRREILRYINAKAGTRAEEIQELLNISEVENTRRSLVRVRNRCLEDVTAEGRKVDAAKEALNVTVQSVEFDEKTVIDITNQHRTIFGGKPIKDLETENVKRDLVLPKAIIGEQSVNVTVLSRDVSTIEELIAQKNLELVSSADSQLRTLLSDIRSDPEQLETIPRLELIRQGLKLLDDTGACPLCEKPWPEGALKKFLEDRLEVAESAVSSLKEINQYASTILKTLDKATASLKKVLATIKAANLEMYHSDLEVWLKDLKYLSDALSAPLQNYPGTDFTEEKVSKLLAPDKMDESLKGLINVLTSHFPESTPEQTAWDMLTRIEENLKGLNIALDSLNEVSIVFNRAEGLLESYLNARDTVLGDLYEQISDSLTVLYQKLHEPDEDKFNASIKPEGAGLDLKVDFHGRGTHPPQALHSEGHQDSLGLCLFLALTDQLTRGTIDLIVLDDVMMSIDTDHRRQLCKVLVESFGDRQFLITTHDKTWARQMRNEGLVTSKRTVEFYNWDIVAGPHVRDESDNWERIETFLSSNEIPMAAALLRRGSEAFFEDVCDSLEAKVTYRADSRYDLGYLMPAGMSRYKELLKKAKSAARSWDDEETYEELKVLESTMSNIFDRTNIENWAVNANVHYNSWAQFNSKDFRPVVEVIQDLHALYICQNCGSLLQLAKKGLKGIGIRCSCGKTNWNLVSNKQMK